MQWLCWNMIFHSIVACVSFLSHTTGQGEQLRKPKMLQHNLLRRSLELTLRNLWKLVDLVTKVKFGQTSYISVLSRHPCGIWNDVISVVVLVVLQNVRHTSTSQWSWVVTNFIFRTGIFGLYHLKIAYGCLGLYSISVQNLAIIWKKKLWCHNKVPYN